MKTINYQSSHDIIVIEVNKFDFEEKAYENNYEYKKYKSVCLVGDMIETPKTDLERLSWLNEMVLDTIGKEKLIEVLYTTKYDIVCILLIED